MYKSFTNISWGTYYFFSQNSGSSKTEEFLTLILFCVLHNVVKSQHFRNLLSKRKLAKKPSRYCLQRSTFQLGYLTTMTGSKEQNFCSLKIYWTSSKRDKHAEIILFLIFFFFQEERDTLYSDQSCQSNPARPVRTCSTSQVVLTGITKFEWNQAENSQGGSFSWLVCSFAVIMRMEGDKWIFLVTCKVCLLQPPMINLLQNAVSPFRKENLLYYRLQNVQISWIQKGKLHLPKSIPGLPVFQI